MDVKCFFILFSIFILTLSPIFSQSVSPKKTFLIGLESGGVRIKGKNINTGEKYYLYSLRLNPYVGYFFVKDIALGATASYEFVKSNYDFQKPAYGYGGFVEYLLPIKLEEKFSKRDRFVLYACAMYMKTNYYLNDGKFIEITSTNQVEENMIALDLGLNTRLFKQFYLQYFFRHDIFLERNKVFTNRIGLEYHFGS